MTDKPKTIQEALAEVQRKINEERAHRISQIIDEAKASILDPSGKEIGTTEYTSHTKSTSSPASTTTSKLGKAAGVAGKVASKVAAPLQFGLDYAERKGAGQSTAKALGGGAASTAGMMGGAALGSALGPIGSIAGGIAGAMGASKAYDWAADKLSDSKPKETPKQPEVSKTPEAPKAIETPKTQTPPAGSSAAKMSFSQAYAKARETAKAQGKDPNIAQFKFDRGGGEKVYQAAATKKDYVPTSKQFKVDIGTTKAAETPKQPETPKTVETSKVDTKPETTSTAPKAPEALGKTVGSLMRGDLGRAGEGAKEWGSAVATSVDRVRKNTADALDPKGAQPEYESGKLKKGKTKMSEETLDELSDFGSAFAAARKSGKTQFSFGGKSYTTAMKGQTGTTAPKTNTPGTQGVATGKSFSAIDKATSAAEKKTPKVLAPTTPQAGAARDQNLKGKPGGEVGSYSSGGSVHSLDRPGNVGARPAGAGAAGTTTTPPPSTTSTSSSPEQSRAAPGTFAARSAAGEMKADAASAGVKKLMKSEETNPLIAAFLKLQSENPSNMFEAAKKAKKDYDKDGKVESPKDEVWGSRFRAAKMAGKMEEEQIDELSKDTLSNYVDKAKKDVYFLHGDPKRSETKIRKQRKAGIKAAKEKLANEEVEFSQAEIDHINSFFEAVAPSRAEPTKGVNPTVRNTDLTDETLEELDKKTLKSYVGKVEKRGETEKRSEGLYRAQKAIAKQTSTKTLDVKVRKLASTPMNQAKHDFEYDASREELKNRNIHHFAGRRTRYEEVELEEGRPKKNPEPASTDRDPRKHIQVEAGRAAAGSVVDFHHNDGSKSKITPAMGRRITSHLQGLKPAERQAAVNKMHASAEGLKV